MWACTRSARWCHTGRMPSSLFWIRNAASASVSWMYVRQRFLGAPVIHVRAQHVAALAPARPVVPLGLRPPLQPHAGAQRRIGHELDDVAASRALVAFEEPAELAFQAAHVERPARLTHAPPQTLETRLDPPRKPLVHRPLFLAALDGADQHERLDPIGPDAPLGFEPVAHRLPVARVGQGARPLLELALRRPDQVPASGLAQPFPV